MSMEVLFRCEVCHKIIKDSELNDFGYGVTMEVGNRGLVYGNLGNHRVHLCRTCIKGIGSLADKLREGEEDDEVDK